MQKNGGIKMTSITPYEKFLQDNRKSGYDNSPFRFNPDGTVKSAKTVMTGEGLRPTHARRCTEK
jgi:hypothetical protein